MTFVRRNCDPILSNFVVLIDTREQRPYAFADMHADARQGNRLIEVRTEARGLASGDYSIDGCEDQIAVERKSLADLYHTLGQDRDRFERELERLAAMKFAAVVVEASWHDILFAPPPHSALNPKTIHRSVLAWTQRFPHVHWFMMDDRRLAEITTFRILERFWMECHKGKKG